MKTLTLLLALAAGLPAMPPSSPYVQTTDIGRFWAAFDRLGEARSWKDSVDLFQREYLDKASPDFAKFIRARNFTASEYAMLVRRCPKFWHSVRPLTERIEGRKAEVEGVLARMKTLLPNFKTPNVCFAIGCLRTGGTTRKGLIMVGAEIAAADASVDVSELGPWLKNVLGKTGDIVSMVAHEAVHTQQKGFPVIEIFSLMDHRRLKLLNMAIVEGSADFITMELLGLNINASIYDYGNLRECDLWREFDRARRDKPYDYSNWLYNGEQSKTRPADLGYFVGNKITEAFYRQAKDKRKALKTILKRGKYKKVLRKGGYKGGC